MSRLCHERMRIKWFYWPDLLEGSLQDRHCHVQVPGRKPHPQLCLKKIQSRFLKHVKMIIILWDIKVVLYRYLTWSNVQRSVSRTEFALLTTAQTPSTDWQVTALWTHFLTMKNMSSSIRAELLPPSWRSCADLSLSVKGTILRWKDKSMCDWTNHIWHTSWGFFGLDVWRDSFFDVLGHVVVFQQ